MYNRRRSGARRSLYRGLIFEDAIDEGLITSDPAARRRGRGRRAGRSRDRGPEKVVTDALGILLTAERATLLSGCDDEFVAVALKGCTGMRWDGIVGLETEFTRPGAVRVDWQPYELGTGELVRCPKGDSYRTIDSTNRLSALVANHIARTKTIDPDEVWHRIDAEPGDLSDVVYAAQRVATVDGDLNTHEKALIAELHERCQRR